MQECHMICADKSGSNKVVLAVEGTENVLVYQSINQSIIYFNTLRQRAKKLVQNTNVYK